MEFYVNFGTTGVIVGFMIFGLIITTLDVLATERLASGDLRGFVLFYLPGLSFLQVGGQLTEITTSAAASLVVALIVNRVLDRLQRKQDAGDQSAEFTGALGHSI
jgi:membrane protein implicated in regulation of membrane protease activity